jgi:acetyltransferase
MTIRNFDALFQPKTIALIGASGTPGSVGAVVARNLLRGGFSGPIRFVNPHQKEIEGAPVFASVAALPETPDLAVIATPAPTVPGLIDELGARGCRAAVVITAGFSQGDLRAKMLSAAGKYLLRIVGPNCLGVLSPVHGVNASFAHMTPCAGSVALVSQSGAIATAMIDWAGASDVGFSHILSLGDMNDADFGDTLDYLALDEKTSAILLYVETITHARKFMSAARIAARAKPVIVVKAGRSAAGARAAATHTGALAGADLVYDAAFRRAGMLRVDGLRDLFDAAATLASGLRVGGDRLLIVTNGGGAGVLATDELEARGGRLAALDDSTRDAMDKVMPANWSRANPVDIIGDAPAARYTSALDILTKASDAQDAILVLNCPTGVADNEACAQATAAAASHAPILTCWLGDATAAKARRIFTANRIPTFETPTDAVSAFMQLVDYRRNQEALMQTPSGGAHVSREARAQARAIIADVLADNRTMLTEPEAKTLLALYNIATVPTRVAQTPEEAAAQARTMAGPFVLKVLSRDISHKSDIGGVKLNLADDQAVQAAAADIAAAVAEKAPGARLDGFALQPMIKRPKAIELIVGLSVDRTFGPVILFGRGGTAVEIVADRAMALPPLNSVLARDVIARTQVSRLLAGYRDVAPADMAAIENVLIGVADLAADFPEIVGLDINPLLADSEGVVALDARNELSNASAGGDTRFAIRPYPASLSGQIETREGVLLSIRPIRPEDEPALQEMVARSRPEDARLRFFGPMPQLHHRLAARLSQIDYDREMAFVAEDDDIKGILGVSRLIIEPNFKRAEYAIMVRSDLKGTGIGYQLMRAILAYARSRGVEVVHGDVLGENAPMLAMARGLGATARVRPDDPHVMLVEFDLQALETAQA